MLIAITLYTLSAAVHVVFVASYLGAASAFSVIGPMAKKSPENALFALKVERKVYETMVFPGMAVVWGTGAYQASDAGFKFDDLWLTISVALFFVMSVVTAVVSYPAVKTAQAELENQSEPGPPSQLALSSLAKLGKVGPFMGITFMVITFLMVAKPF